MSDMTELLSELVAIDSVNPALVPGGAGETEIAAFVAAWLTDRGLEVTIDEPLAGRPSVVGVARGSGGGASLMLNAHMDTVNVDGMERPHEPVIRDGRLYGRGAYDMKGALACLLLALADLRSQDQVRVRLGIVPDEESEEETDRGGDRLVEAGFVGDFAITGEPTDLNVGVAAKGVLAMRLLVSGRAAHGATPWLGENAILRAYEVFREVESLPFAGQSSELFDRPSINLGRILGGDALNKVPDSCVIDVDVRYLPEQDPGEILAQVRGLEGTRVISTFSRPPAEVDPELPYVLALRDAAGAEGDGTSRGVVGRDGASDAVSFLRAGVPAVEYGPIGGGHHGPEEWVSVPSLERYRRSIVEFVNSAPRIAQ